MVTPSSAAELVLPDEPNGDTARQAIASLRGYTYQIYASALAWFELKEGESLWLEVAEDYATVARDALHAVQVKDTTASGPVTLRSQSVRDAIEGFVDLVERNKDKRVQLRFLTTSSIGLERNRADRPDGMEGLQYWRKAADASAVGPLRDVLLADGALSTRAAAFVRAHDDEALREHLLRRIQWDCGSQPVGELQRELEIRLIRFGVDQLRLPPSECVRLAPVVLAEVLRVAATRDKRRLDAADLAALIDAATRVSLRRQDVDRLMASKKAGDWLQPVELTVPAPGSVDDKTAVAARREALGREPSWRLLRNGVYCPRPYRLTEALRELESWLEGCWTDSTRVPVFWIGGRSGDGKSVLLLQLAAEYLSRNSRAYVALSSPAQLLDSIERHERMDEPVLFVVDDLHKALASEDFNRRLKEFLEGGIGRIAVLACGPTPEMEGFRKACRDTIAIENWTMPTLDDDERPAFISWLQLPVPFEDSRSDLLVEFLFELKVGEPLAVFAENFRERLNRHDAFQPVKQVLAVNSLDLTADLSLVPTGNPTSWLQRLEKSDQRHFDLDSPMLSGAKGIRFAHTRIAWRLFAEWTHDSELQISIDKRFAEALGPSLVVTADRWIDANAILNAVWSRYPSLISDLGISGTPEGLATELSISVRPNVLSEARVVRSFTVAHARQLIPALSKEIIVRAQSLISAADLTGAVKCSLAAGLLLVSIRDQMPEREAIIEQTRQVLFEPLNQDFAGTALIFLVGQLDAAQHTIQSWPRQWAYLFPKAASLPAVLRWLFQPNFFDRYFVDLALDWLGDPKKERPGATAVLESLLAILEKVDQSTKARIVNHAFDWLGDPKKERAGATAVLGPLLAVLDKVDQPTKARIVSHALDWLDDPDRIGASKVLGPLLAVLDKVDQPTKARIVNHALDWLGDPKSDRPGATAVLASLLAILDKVDQPTKARIVNHALDWLGDPKKKRPGATAVLASLLAILDKVDQSTKARIVDHALGWLGDSKKDSSDAATVLGPLLAILDKVDQSTKARIVDHALDWLGSPKKDRPGTNNVLAPLLANLRKVDQSTQARIISHALDWLGDPKKDRPGTNNMLASLLAIQYKIDQSTQARIVSHALDWLGDPKKDRPGANNVLASLLAIQYRIDQSTQARIVNHALDWLGDPKMDRPGANNVLESLLAALDKTDQSTQTRIVDHALDWIGDSEKHRPGANNVLKSLLAILGRIDQSTQARIVNHALDWLGDSKKDRPGANIVLAQLLANLGKIDQLTQARIINHALDWFETFGERDGAQNVIRGLCYVGKDDIRIRDKLLTWASQSSSDKQLGFFVLSFLSIFGADSSVRALAEACWKNATSVNFQAPLLLGLVSAYSDDPTVVSRVVAHLGLERSPLNSQICQRWLERSSDPASVIKLVLEIPGVRGGPNQRPSPASGAIQVALARSIDVVFGAILQLSSKDESDVIQLLRRGARRSSVEGAAEALLDRIDNWPKAHIGAMFRTLLESPLETARFSDRLLSWLNQDISRPFAGYREVILALSADTRRDADLLPYVTPALKRAVEQERARRIARGFKKPGQPSTP